MIDRSPLQPKASPVSTPPGTRGPGTIARCACLAIPSALRWAARRVPTPSLPNSPHRTLKFQTSKREQQGGGCCTAIHTECGWAGEQNSSKPSNMTCGHAHPPPRLNLRSPEETQPPVVMVHRAPRSCLLPTYPPQLLPPLANFQDATASCPLLLPQDVASRGLAVGRVSPRGRSVVCVL